jgi:hypothetical protein
MPKTTKKDLQDSFTEWSTRVPKRWWEMLNVPLTFIPLLIGVILFAHWTRNTTPPLSWWIISLVIGGAILFFVVSFWAFHRVKMERDEARKNRDAGIELTKQVQQKDVATLSIVQHKLAFDGGALRTKVFRDCIVVQVGAIFRNTCQEVIEMKVTKFNATVAGKTVENPRFSTTSGFVYPLQTRDYYFEGIRLEGKPKSFLGTLEYEVLYSSVPNTQWYKSTRKMSLEFIWEKSNLKALYRMEEELEE